MRKILFTVFIAICCLTILGCTKNTKENKTNNIATLSTSQDKNETTSKQEEKFTITVMNGTGSGEYNKNSSVTLTANIPEGKEFSHWTKNGVKVSEQNPYKITVTKNDTYEAIFKNTTINFQVINGKITGTLEKDSIVTITADTKDNGTFDHWEVDGVNISSENPYSFTLTEEMTVSAIYNEFNRIASYTTNVIKKNEVFKVLCFADIQQTDDDDLTLTFHIMDTLVEEEKPDMIVILGDTINDSKYYDSKTASKNIIEHIDSFGIPWAPVFGNHDYNEYQATYSSKKTAGTDYLISLFNDAENCLFIKGPSDVLGKSNYMVNVIDEETEDIVESFIFLDSRINGLDNTSVSFYNECIEYLEEITDGTTVPSVIFNHIPIQEYEDSLRISETLEFRDIVGLHAGNGPLVCGDHSLFNKIKEFGSTKTVICGHDHEDAYYSVYQGVTLAHGMKSSDGDDENGISFRHPLGGLVLVVDGIKDELYYNRVEDISYKVASGADFPYHPDVVPYFMYSGAKLVFDIELPSTGTIKFNLEGTNLMRDSVDYNYRVGIWNRLTTNVTINAATKSVDLGKLTLVNGNKYRYELDLADVKLNTSGGEEVRGDETLRLVYFHSAIASFTITNIHFEYEEIIETNQIDLIDALVEAIQDQYFNGIPSKPEPTVTIGGKTLVKGTNIIYTYSNNSAIGEATLTVIPSGKGAHQYKGSITVKFNIVSNPDDDKQSGHENATTVNGNNSYVTSDKYNEWIKVNDWYNCGKKLHLEVKRLENGVCKTGETVRFTLMGANTNEGEGQCDKGGNWNRLTGYYIIDFSDDKVVCYEAGKPQNIIATGVSLGDGWFSLDIDFKSLTLNSAENVHGNDKEIMQRVEFSQLKRSFKFDNVSLVN